MEESSEAIRVSIFIVIEIYSEIILFLDLF